MEKSSTPTTPITAELLLSQELARCVAELEELLDVTTQCSAVNAQVLAMKMQQLELQAEYIKCQAQTIDELQRENEKLKLQLAARQLDDARLEQRPAGDVAARARACSVGDALATSTTAKPSERHAIASDPTLVALRVKVLRTLFGHEEGAGPTSATLVRQQRTAMQVQVAESASA